MPSYLLEKCRGFKKTYFDENVDLPIQFLFAWFFLRILSLLHIFFAIKFILVFLFFIFVVLTWSFIGVKIFRNVFFQIYLAYFYSLINFLLETSWRGRFTGF